MSDYEVSLAVESISSTIKIRLHGVKNTKESFIHTLILSEDSPAKAATKQYNYHYHFLSLYGSCESITKPAVGRQEKVEDR